MLPLLLASLCLLAQAWPPQDSIEGHMLPAVREELPTLALEELPALASYQSPSSFYTDTAGNMAASKQEVRQGHKRLLLVSCSVSVVVIQ